MGKDSKTKSNIKAGTISLGILIVLWWLQAHTAFRPVQAVQNEAPQRAAAVPQAVAPEYQPVLADPERLEYQTNKVFELMYGAPAKFRGLHMVSHVETDGSTTQIVCGEYAYTGLTKLLFTRFILDNKYGEAHGLRDDNSSLQVSGRVNPWLTTLKFQADFLEAAASSRWGTLVDPSVHELRKRVEFLTLGLQDIGFSVSGRSAPP